MLDIVKMWKQRRHGLTMDIGGGFMTLYKGKLPIARLIPRANGNVTLRTIKGDEEYTSSAAAMERVIEQMRGWRK